MSVWEHAYLRINELAARQVRKLDNAVHRHSEIVMQLRSVVPCANPTLEQLRITKDTGKLPGAGFWG